MLRKFHLQACSTFAGDIPPVMCLDMFAMQSRFLASSLNEEQERVDCSLYVRCSQLKLFLRPERRSSRNAGVVCCKLSADPGRLGGAG